MLILRLSYLITTVQRTRQMECDKCSLLLCVEILVGYVISKFYQKCSMLKYAGHMGLCIGHSYGNNGYGEEVRWSCSDNNLCGASFYKMSVFHHFVTFHISQDYLVKMDPHFVSSPSSYFKKCHRICLIFELYFTLYFRD